MTGTAGLGIAAAIAIPALLRARVSANESAAIGDIRTVISAQAMYESANGGYGELRCLGEPKSCLPNYDGPPFLDPVLASLEDKNGYHRGFFPGPPGPRPGTYQSYAYTAAPVTPSRTGIRSFCGADDGVICQRMDGQPIAAEGGRCPSDCLPLR
jgi:type II secretory pathway pseudopilin PulG